MARQPRTPRAAASPAGGAHRQPGGRLAHMGRFADHLDAIGAELVGTFRDERGYLRARVVCGLCRARGGCGWEPRPELAYGSRKAGRCHRRRALDAAALNRLGEAEARARLEARGWSLAGPFTSAKSPVLARCPEGHEGLYVFEKLAAGQRCRRCRAYLGEEAARAVLEAMYGVTLTRCRPAFLGGLELDGYTLEPHPSLGFLAFEHQGQQHHRDVGPGRGRQDVAATQGRDRRKAELARREGVRLVVVEDLSALAGREDERSRRAIAAAVEAAARAAGLPVPAAYPPPDFARVRSQSALRLERRLRELGLELRGQGYAGNKDPVQVWCPAHGMAELATPESLHQRRHCCAEGRRLALAGRSADGLAARLAALAGRGVRPAGKGPRGHAHYGRWAMDGGGRERSFYLAQLEAMSGPGLEAAFAVRRPLVSALPVNVLRRARGLGVRELARVSGVPAGTLGKVTAGSRPMTPGMAARLAPALGCAPADLMPGA